MTNQELIDAADIRYLRAMHAMQSGVAAELANGEAQAGATPKHLRVGINSAMINDCAIAKLLIAKGIFSKVEYHEAIANAAEKEQARYEAILSERLGKDVKLS